MHLCPRVTLLTTVARGLLYQNHFSFLYLTIYFVSACACTCAQVPVEARRGVRSSGRIWSYRWLVVSHARNPSSTRETHTLNHGAIALASSPHSFKTQDLWTVIVCVTSSCSLWLRPPDWAGRKSSETIQRPLPGGQQCT